MSGTITGELRAMAREGGAPIVVSSITADGMVETQTCCVDKADFGRCCDAIDAVHANLERENESLRRELDRVLGEQEDRDGWVELPKDADGEVWHVGDFIVGEVNPRNPKAIERMIWYGPDSGWQLETNTIIYPCPDRPRHHHATTVEDLLFSYGQACIRTSNEAETDAAKQTMLARLREDYAAKLRLAEGEDA